MAKRTKRSAIVPRIVRGTIAVGVIPAFTATTGCGSSQPPPVVAAMGPEYGARLDGDAVGPGYGPTPPVVAAMVQPPQPPEPGESNDAGSPDPTPTDAGADAQTGSTTNAKKKAR